MIGGRRSSYSRLSSRRQSMCSGLAPQGVHSTKTALSSLLTHLCPIQVWSWLGLNARILGGSGQKLGLFGHVTSTCCYPWGQGDGGGRERPFEGSSRSASRAGAALSAWRITVRVDPLLGIASHLWFPAPGGAFVAPRPAPDLGVEVGRLQDPRSWEVCGEGS